MRRRPCHCESLCRNGGGRSLSATKRPDHEGFVRADRRRQPCPAAALRAVAGMSLFSLESDNLVLTSPNTPALPDKADRSS